jgi:hypothetical protein
VSFFDACSLFLGLGRDVGSWHLRTADLFAFQSTRFSYISDINTNGKSDWDVVLSLPLRSCLVVGEEAMKQSHKIKLETKMPTHRLRVGLGVAPSLCACRISAGNRVAWRLLHGRDFPFCIGM